MAPKIVSATYRAIRRAGGTILRRTSPALWERIRPVPAPTPPPYSSLNIDRYVAGGGLRPRGLRLQEGSHQEQALLEGRYFHPVFVDHTDFEHPPADLAFVTVCNDKYTPGLEALLLSLLRVYPSMQADFVVLHDGSLSPLFMRRLEQIYSGVRFVLGDTSRYSVTMGDHVNHRRVGLLGYLTIEALGMAEPSHVIVLDSDLLVLGDISPLWRTERIAAAPDIGNLPFGVVSAATGQPVINSGVISLPRSERGPEAVERARAVLAKLDENTDESIARFADQKFWNVYLWQRDFELLPQNFNTIKTLVSKTHRGELGSAKILHLTGPKPWFSFINEHMLTPVDRTAFRKGSTEFREIFALWNQVYWSEIVRSRVTAFLREESARLDELEGSVADRPVALIGNGPSIGETDMSAFAGYEKIVFNWFTRHDDFDEIRPDHLVLASHMLFGGWHTARPELPREFLDSLLRHEHRPRIWTSFYFKPYVEELPELRDYEVSYFLFEKPFKRQIAHSGSSPLDVRKPLVDSNTGVLTAGVPIALLLGARTMVLTGCDSNYESTHGSYFYQADQHASATTRADSLSRTWAEGGEGVYGYGIVQSELARRGVELFDSTINGRLTMLPRLTLDEVRARGASPAARA